MEEILKSQNINKSTFLGSPKVTEKLIKDVIFVQATPFLQREKYC